MRITSIIVFFLCLSAFLIISNQNIALKESGALMEFGKLYYSWFLGMFSNIAHITGNVISSTWLPNTHTNLTNSTSNISSGILAAG